MNRVLRRAAVFVLACLMFLSCTAFAADGVEAPENGVTIAEVIKMAEVAFGDVNNLPDERWWAEQSDEYKGWNRTFGYNTSSIWLWRADTTLASREFASNIILQINGENVVPHPEYYGYDKYAFYTAYLSVCAKGFDSLENYNRDAARAHITIDEYRNLIAWAGEHIHDGFAVPDKDDIVVFDNKYADGVENLDDKVTFLQYKLQAIPEEFRRAFTKDGFKIYVSNDKHWHALFDELSDQSTSGWFVPSKKAIFVHEDYFDDSLTLEHEFGHYVDWHFGYAPSKACKSLLGNADECDGMIAVTFRDYCQTNEREYFADAYYAYLLRGDRLAERAPKTYDTVRRAVSGR